MQDTEMKELVNLSDSIIERLDKAAAMLALLQGTKTSDFNDQIIHENLQAIHDFIDETKQLHGNLWSRVIKL